MRNMFDGGRQWKRAPAVCEHNVLTSHHAAYALSHNLNARLPC